MPTPVAAVLLAGLGAVLGVGAARAASARLRTRARPLRLPAACAATAGGLGAAAGAAGATGLLAPEAALVLGLLGVWAVLLVGADVVALRLPDALTGPGAAVAVAGAGLAGRLGPALLGAAVLAGAHLAVHLAAPRALGAGDVKLAVGLGAVTAACGPDAWVLAALGAPVLTGLGGIGLLALRRGGRGTALPHGPGMAVAAWLAVAAALT